MIFLILPYNHYTGWGVCSVNLATEICKNHKIRYVTLPNEFKNSLQPNPIETDYFKKFFFDNLEYLTKQTDFPIIQAVEHDLKPFLGYFSGSKRIAITFSDRNIPPTYIEGAKKNFDHIIAGSNYCQKVLAEVGINSTVIHQGVNHLYFNKKRQEKIFFKDDFVIFSGGKFELRKGQDKFIQAYKKLQDKYVDVRLVVSWANTYTDNDGFKEIKKFDLDLNRITFVPLMTNACMPEIYQNTDIGVFPSRCEAGTNLVMMEYMACGKPVIATVKTGQGDVVTKENGYAINSGVFLLKSNDDIIANWEEPSSDHIYELLEHCYENREELKEKGDKAYDSMREKTWSHMANSILDLIEN